MSTTTIEIILPAGIWNAYADRSQWLSVATASAGAVRQAGNCSMVPLVVVTQPDQDDAATMRTGRRDAVPVRHKSCGREHLFLQSNACGQGRHPLEFVDGKRLRPKRAVSATVHANGKIGYASLVETMWGARYKIQGRPPHPGAAMETAGVGGNEKPRDNPGAFLCRVSDEEGFSSRL